MTRGLLTDNGADGSFPSLEDIERAEPEFWHRIKEHGSVDPYGSRPTTAAIAENNFRLLLRYRDFRRAAEYVASELESVPFVTRTSLFGSLTKPLVKEVPRFYDFRKYGIKLWHEVKDIDLAVWITALDDLQGLKQARSRGVTRLQKEKGINVAPHDCDLFLFDAADNRYLGRVCHWKECPRMRPECEVPGCGKITFLRQHADFELRPEALTDGTVFTFFDKGRGDSPFKSCAEAVSKSPATRLADIKGGKQP